MAVPTSFNRKGYSYEEKSFALTPTPSEKLWSWAPCRIVYLLFPTFVLGVVKTKFHNDCAVTSRLSSTSLGCLDCELQLFPALCRLVTAMAIPAYNEHFGHWKRQQPEDGIQCRLLGGCENWSFRAASRLHHRSSEVDRSSESSRVGHIYRTWPNAVAWQMVTDEGVVEHSQLSCQSCALHLLNAPES